MSGGPRDTGNIAKEELKKAESKTAGSHGGEVPSDSDISQLKSMIDSQKAGEVESAKSNLPLPEDPPVTSDFSSADSRTTGPGSGKVSGPGGSEEETSGLKGPATGESSVRTAGNEWKTATAPDGNIGRQGKEGLENLPNDATAR